MKELYIKNSYANFKKLTAKEEIETCPYLTDLSFKRHEHRPGARFICRLHIRKIQ